MASPGNNPPTRMRTFIKSILPVFTAVMTALMSSAHLA